MAAHPQRETQPCSPRRRRRDALRDAALLVLACAAGLLPGLGRLPVSRQQELRVVLTARDMAGGGNWLAPRFMGEPRFRKPPLMYWTVAVASKFSGTAASAACSRAPSVAAGTLLVLAVHLLGRRLVGPSRSLAGAFLLATSLGFIRHARLAETDIPLVLWTSLAAFAGYRAMTGRRAAAAWAAAGIFAGLGFLTKGPAAVVLPALAWAAFAASGPFDRTSLAPAKWLPGLALAAALALSWYALVIRSPDAGAAAQQQIGRELRDTFVRSAHQGSPLYYLYTLPKILLPWGWLLPVAAWMAARMAGRRRGVRFLLAWLASSLAVLTLIPSKQAHYALLMAPPSALLIGCLAAPPFLAAGTWRRRLTAAAAGVVLAGVPACMAGAIATAIRAGNPPHASTWLLAAAAAALAIAVTAVPVLRRRGIPAAGFCIALAASAYATDLHRAFDEDVIVERLLRRQSAALEGAARLHVSGPRTAAVSFYAARPVVPARDPAEAWAAAGPGDAVVAVDRGQPASAPPSLPAPPVDTLGMGDMRISLFIKPGGVP